MGWKMLENETENPYRASPYVKNKNKLTTVVCFITSFLAGLTVWSINGTVTTVSHHASYYQEWDEVNTYAVDPVIQGILAFLTMGFLLWSVTLLAYAQK
jgi:hypothetical protein